MKKIKAWFTRHTRALQTMCATAMASMMLVGAGAAGEGAFDMSTVMGTATDNVVTSLQGIAAAVIPKGIVVLAIIIGLRFGKSIIRSVTGGR